MEYIIFAISLFFLIKAGDIFVDSSINIAKYFHLSEVIIGATIVSIGTTLPELMVSAGGALSGHSDISYGNAIGSIICNTCLVAGLSVSVLPSKVKRESLRIPLYFFIVSAFYYMFKAYIYGGFNRIDGVILVSIFILYVIVIIFKESKKQQEKNIIEKIEERIQKKVLIKNIICLVLSAIVIAISSNQLVTNGIIIAKNLGVPESVIALTMIAFGTSIPELTTCITSLVKGHSNISFGNIIGANFFNIVIVSGVSILISPFDLPSEKTIFGINSSLIIDVPFMVFAVLFIYLIAYIKEKTYRFQGIILLILYFGFVVYQFLN